MIAYSDVEYIGRADIRKGCQSVIVDNGLAYMETKTGPKAEHRGTLRFIGAMFQH